MRQTACARRFLPAMIGGGTWEGAPMFGMRRREFMALLGGAAAACPIASQTSSTALREIGGRRKAALLLRSVVYAISHATMAGGRARRIAP